MGGNHEGRLRWRCPLRHRLCQARQFLGRGFRIFAGEPIADVACWFESGQLEDGDELQIGKYRLTFLNR